MKSDVSGVTLWVSGSRAAGICAVLFLSMLLLAKGVAAQTSVNRRNVQSHLKSESGEPRSSRAVGCITGRPAAICTDANGFNWAFTDGHWRFGTPDLGFDEFLQRLVSDDDQFRFNAVLNGLVTATGIVVAAQGDGNGTGGNATYGAYIIAMNTGDGYVVGSESDAYSMSSGTTLGVWGVEGYAELMGTGISTNGVAGVVGYGRITGGGSAPFLTSFLAPGGGNGAYNVISSGAAVVNAGFYSGSQAGVSANLNAAFYAEDQGGGANDYAFYAVGGKSYFGGQLNFPSALTAGTANAGANGYQPAQVAGYLLITIDGKQRKIPYYAD